MDIFLIPLVAVILPFMLWPLEIYFPYPAILEEIAKVLLIFFLLKQTEDKRTRIIFAIAIGLLFTFSESVLYMFNIFSVGNLQTLAKRFLFTGTLHVGTALLMVVVALKNEKLLLFGFIIAVILHTLYNQYLGFGGIL